MCNSKIPNTGTPEVQNLGFYKEPKEKTFCEWLKEIEKTKEKLYHVNILDIKYKEHELTITDKNFITYYTKLTIKKYFELMVKNNPTINAVFRKQ